MVVSGGVRKSSTSLDILCQTWDDAYPAYQGQDTMTNAYYFQWNRRDACLPTPFQQQCRACSLDVAYCASNLRSCACFGDRARACYGAALTMAGAPFGRGCNVTKDGMSRCADARAVRLLLFVDSGSLPRPVGLLAARLRARRRRRRRLSVVFRRHSILFERDEIKLRSFCSVDAADAHVGAGGAGASCKCFAGASSCFAGSACQNSFHLLQSREQCVTACGASSNCAF